MGKIYSSINNLQKTLTNFPSVETIYIDINEAFNSGISFKIDVSLLKDGDLCYATLEDYSQVSYEHIENNFRMYKIPLEKVSELLESRDKIILTIDWEADERGYTIYRNQFKFIPSNNLLEEYKIDLSTSLRHCYDNQGIEISKENPFCLGLELDEKANNFRIKFVNAECVSECQCIVSLEAANGNKSIQEIKSVDCSEGTFNDNNTINEDVTEIVLNWKPNNFLMQEKGLVKFAFQFYRLNKNGEYDFVLNTAPIYGYVHEGLNVVQGIGSNIYPSEIADLYSKYNSLLNDEDIADLDSFEDIKLYLQTLVPYNLDTKTQEANTDDTSNSWYVLAYSPSQKRYSYVPTTKLGLDAIYGQIWNAGEYKGIEVNIPQKEKPEMTWDDKEKYESSPTI